MQTNLRIIYQLNLDYLTCYQKIFRKEKEIVTFDPFKDVKGHFEKKEIKEKQYIYVNSDEPSNIPNSFVISSFEATNNDIKDDFD